MKKLDFTVPFSGFASTTFVNCFASVYMYLEKIAPLKGPAALCNQWLHGQCNSCGNCAHKPQALQERYFFLFDTLCGRSALRLRYDGVRTEADCRINGSCGEAQALYAGGGACLLYTSSFRFYQGGYREEETHQAVIDMMRMRRLRSEPFMGDSSYGFAELPQAFMDLKARRLVKARICLA